MTDRVEQIPGNRSPEQMAIKLSLWLRQFGLTVALAGSGERWEVKYFNPDFPEEDYPAMIIDGPALRIPKGSPELLAQLLLMMAMGGKPN